MMINPIRSAMENENFGMDSNMLNASHSRNICIVLQRESGAIGCILDTDSIGSAQNYSSGYGRSRYVENGPNLLP